MINFSKLGYGPDDLRNLMLLLKEFRNSNISLNYKSRPVILFLSTLIALAGLGVYFTIKNVVGRYKDYTLKQRLIRPNLIRQLLTVLKNGLREIFIDTPSGTTRIIIPKPNLDQYAADKYLYKLFKETEEFNTKHQRLAQLKFLNQLIIIWRILVPRFYGKNTTLLMSQCFFLIFRTWLSLLVAKLDGQIVKNLIAGNGRKFSRDLIYWVLIAFPASYTNAAIKYLTNRLLLAFRTNLTRYIHDMYLDKEMAYYKVGLNSLGELENIDQYITNDVANFCDSLSGLFSLMGKPFVDLIFFSVYLRDNLGTGAITGIFANYFLTAWMLKKATPKFGELAKKKTQLEGSYFNQHLNLMNNSEEIGFYQGSLIEKTKLRAKFDKLMSQINVEINTAFPYAVLEDYVLKYTWLAWGYIFAGLPVFLDELWPKKDAPAEADIGETEKAGREPSSVANQRQNMRQFIINKRLMLLLADAGLRLMYLIKDVLELTGYTDRVFNLLLNLHRVHSPRFDFGSKYGISDINGTIQQNYNKGLRFEHIPVIIPLEDGSHGTALVEDLNFKMLKNMLVLGLNGCGKTLIARIMAGLWPLYLGLLLKPLESDLMYLPQKTYFTTGNLRDQIIYPYLYDEMIAMGYNDDYLYHILREVKLEYLLEREGNFNVVKDWKDVFSGGEKQRVLIARVLFKNPKFVVLDEATNAVSTDVEDYLFELLQQKKIAFITLSHRPSLMKYHDLVLELKDLSHWVLHDLLLEENLKTIDDEIADLKHKLAQVEQWEKRKTDIELYLDGKYEDLQEPDPQVIAQSESKEGPQVGATSNTAEDAKKAARESVKAAK